jgi:hypothetical protein
MEVEIKLVSAKIPFYKQQFLQTRRWIRDIASKQYKKSSSELPHYELKNIIHT